MVEGAPEAMDPAPAEAPEAEVPEPEAPEPETSEPEPEVAVSDPPEILQKVPDPEPPQATEASDEAQPAAETPAPIADATEAEAVLPSDLPEEILDVPVMSAASPPAARGAVPRSQRAHQVAAVDRHRRAGHCGAGL